jgi:hypothetical protein
VPGEGCVQMRHPDIVIMTTIRRAIFLRLSGLPALKLPGRAER